MWFILASIGLIFLAICSASIAVAIWMNYVNEGMDDLEPK